MSRITIHRGKGDQGEGGLAAIENGGNVAVAAGFHKAKGSRGVGQVVRWFGGPLGACQINPDHVTAFFGGKNIFDGIKKLKRISSHSSK